MNQKEISRTPLMLVLSSPSGAGKTTMSKMLLEADQNIGISISATTRPARPGEVDGIDYHFLTVDAFDDLVKQGAFLEYATVHGHQYGTLISEVENIFATGRDVLFDIDYQGTQQIAQKSDGRLVSIFLLPPDMEALATRLKQRGQDSVEVVNRRLAKARDEISHYSEYHYVLVNDDRVGCFARINSILTAERLKRERQSGLADWVRNLIS